MEGTEQMKFSANFAAAATLAVAACGRAEQAPEQPTMTNQPQSTELERVHPGAGTVTAVAGNQVTIKHGPIESIGWPAMTMTFTAPDDVAAGVQPGRDVEFSFRDDGGTYVLTSIRQR
jgi:Cu(I)/Ag(I) efflux system protein CusF